MDTAQKRCNVLLLMTDQQRFDTLHCAGNETIATPNLDRLAAEGTIFRSAYTSCPSCIPARAMLMTGMNQWKTGILGMGEGQGHMGTNFPFTLPGELARAGYYCKGVGKMHFFPQRSLNGFHHIELDESGRHQDPDFCCDYETWYHEQCGQDTPIGPGRNWNGWCGRPYDMHPHLHPTAWTGERSIRFLRDRDRSRPFFLKTSFARPHSPYDAIPEYFNRYLDNPPPEPWIGDWADKHADPTQIENPAAWHGLIPPGEIRLARAGYYGNVSHIDAQIGRLLDELQRQGILDDTLILFTSDHGDMLGDHHMWRKTYAYEGSAHIPFLVRLPKDLRQNTPASHDAPVSLADVMPTILDTLGLPTPEMVDGLSVLPLAQGHTAPWRDFVHGEHCANYFRDEEMQYLSDGKIKYIWFTRTGQEQLFDLTADPGERHDLANNRDWQTTLLKMRQRLADELAPRNITLQADGTLPLLERAFVSPHYQERLDGMPEQDHDVFRFFRENRLKTAARK